MSDDKIIIVRSTDDINDAIGKWGGILGFFSIFGSWIATRFGTYNIFRVMAMELFENNRSLDTHDGEKLDLGWGYNIRKFLID
jgi:hypothetical protein